MATRRGKGRGALGVLAPLLGHWRAEGAVALEADMPAGRARMSFAPPPEGDGFVFAVESRTARGWRRFVEHRFLPAGDPA